MPPVIKDVLQTSFLYNNYMKKVLAIVGPTAVGKTEFGIECANCFDGEIISGDSIQIYKGLNIGSAKPTEEELKRAKHHLINIKEANEPYNVKEFQDLGREKIDEICKQNKLPIIVGGTGLYVKALLYDYTFFEEYENDNQYNDLTNQQIYDKLMQFDPKALESIHINNRKRLVRALNVYEKHNKGISEIKDNQQHKPIYDCLLIGLTTSRENLYNRIDQRIDKMINDGLIKEIKELLDSGINFDNQCMQAIGYKEFKDYFEGSKTLEECTNLVKINSHHFAKRQYTFFNNQMNIEWFEDKKEAIQRVKQWLI